MVIFLYNFFDLSYPFARQAIIMGRGDLRFQPKLSFPIAAVNMNMHARLFSGEKEKSVTFLPKNGRAHNDRIIA